MLLNNLVHATCSYDGYLLSNRYLKVLIFLIVLYIVRLDLFACSVRYGWEHVYVFEQTRWLLVAVTAGVRRVQQQMGFRYVGASVFRLLGGCTFARDSSFSKNSDCRLSALLLSKGYLQNPQPELGTFKISFLTFNGYFASCQHFWARRTKHQKFHN